MKRAFASILPQPKSTAQLSEEQEGLISPPRTPNKLRKEPPPVKDADTQSNQFSKKLFKPRLEHPPKGIQDGYPSRPGSRRNTTDDAIVAPGQQHSSTLHSIPEQELYPHDRNKQIDRRNHALPCRSASLDSRPADSRPKSNRRTSHDVFLQDRPSEELQSNSHRRTTSHKHRDRGHRRAETQQEPSQLHSESQNTVQPPHRQSREERTRISSRRRHVSEPDIHNPGPAAITPSSSLRSSRELRDQLYPEDDYFRHPRFKYNGGHISDAHFISSKFVSSFQQPATPASVPRARPGGSNKRQPRSNTGKPSNVIIRLALNHSFRQIGAFLFTRLSRLYVS
jgi:hypothetical protein